MSSIHHSTIKGGLMKIALVTMAGLTIGTLILISAFQLLKVVIQEMVDMATEAWYSPEQE
jgi:divalent metal cation (Fe/Co/Zn/Cd) transporter